MTSCDDFEVAIEQRLHGGLDGDPAERLAQHLSSCPACRAFEARSEELEQAMRMHAAVAIGDVDWNRLGRNLERWRKQMLAGAWKGLAAVIVAAPLLGLVFGRGAIATGVIAGLAVVAWGRIVARRSIAGAREVEHAPGSLLVLLRTQLDRLIEIEKQNALVLPFLALIPIGGLLAAGELTPWRIAGAAALMLLLAAFALRSRFVVLPRLLRERAELE
ncbi:MAG TPA: zf-HC2 domain-containing protein [Kofleriaceae bacterium]|nr:zf-HC2 domain-containing protein [Kofleriaceae bacterium]